MPSCPAPSLQAVDETGAAQTVGADDFVLEFRGRASVWGDIADNQDGTYSVRVIAEEQDYFATFMSIMLDGQHIEGSLMVAQYAASLVCAPVLGFLADPCAY